MSKRDIGASVRQRLLNRAYEQGRPFQELLQYFVMERFLYRLSKSQFRDSFILKGALLLTAWRAPQSRPTMDIDLMGRADNDLEHIRSVVQEICGLAVEQDGAEFASEAGRCAAETGKPARVGARTAVGVAQLRQRAAQTRRA